MQQTQPTPVRFSADPIAIRAAFQALAQSLSVTLPWKPLASSLEGTSDYAKVSW